MKQSKYLTSFAIAFLLQLFFTPVIFGQNITITGKVKDASSDRPVEAVCVQVKGSTVQTFTDSAGFYKIIAPPKGKLVFSNQLFMSKKVAIKGKKTINVAMIYVPEKVLNTGYGTVKASETSQNVESVDRKAIAKDNTTDIIHLLETVPNVKVVNDGGELKILIRGIRSLNSDNYALVVLNGSEFHGSLADLDRSSIKSIDVLKDPASTSAYGSRGGNGVVLITTK